MFCSFPQIPFPETTKRIRMRQLEARKNSLEAKIREVSFRLEQLKYRLREVRAEIENKPKKLTVAELEQKLGYSIEIVSE